MLKRDPLSPSDVNIGGKTRNIAIQLVLQQCCKTSCTFFVARFSVPSVLWSASHLVDAASPRNIGIDKKKISSGTRSSEQPSFKRKFKGAFCLQTKIFRRPFLINKRSIFGSKMWKTQPPKIVSKLLEILGISKINGTLIQSFLAFLER